MSNKPTVTQKEIWDAKSKSIIAVISSCRTLKRVGRHYATKCPFHDDKVPSLYIYPWSNSWYCHACGIGSDTIEFIRRVTKSSFVDAVKYINFIF